MAGLPYAQHAYKLSDEAVAARWVENPYCQHFCGETFFQHRAPINPSSLTRWRNRIGEEGAEWLLTKTIEAGRASGAVEEKMPGARVDGHHCYGDEHCLSDRRSAVKARPPEAGGIVDPRRPTLARRRRRGAATS